jgi:uncharacterized membrane protein YcaP (DUF421 family)
MKHILTILIMMLALGSYASEPSVTDSISSAEKVDTMALHAGKSWVNRILDYFNDSKSAVTTIVNMKFHPTNKL